MKSVLAAPLRVAGRPVGSVQVYHTEKHTWTDEQVTLLESLAAQTSISLEASEMFGRIEDERKRLTTVLETVPFGVAITDARGGNVTFNSAGAASWMKSCVCLPVRSARSFAPGLPRIRCSCILS